MRVYIPSLNRQQDIKTHLLLDGAFEYYIVVHDPLQLYQYKQNQTIPPERLICSYAPRNISAQRNWILNELVQPGEWICFMDDNCEAITAVKEEVYHEPDLSKIYPGYFKKNNPGFRREFYDQAVSQERLIRILNEMRDKAEEIGTTFAAMNAQQNYFFSRDKKWKYYSLICSKVCLIKNCGMQYDEKITTMDDYSRSVAVMLKYGKVLVNAYTWPKSKHNAKGGIGTLNERAERKIADCARLNEQYPGLFRYKERKNSVPMGEIVLRGYGEKFFDKWRNAHAKTFSSL